MIITMATLIAKSVALINDKPETLHPRHVIHSEVSCGTARWALNYLSDPVNHVLGFRPDLNPVGFIRTCVYYGLMTGGTVRHEIPNNKDSHLEHSALAQIMNHFIPNPICNQVAHDLLQYNNDDYSAQNREKQAEMAYRYTECLRQSIDSYGAKKVTLDW